MRWSRWAVVAVVVLAATVLVVWLGQSQAAGPSTLSASGSGWLAARRYLERRGHATATSDLPLGARRSEALVTAFPWESGLAHDDMEIRGSVSRGEDLVIAYSGSRRGAEERFLELFGIRVRDVRGDVPLGPASWFRYRTQIWRLQPAVAFGSPAVTNHDVVCIAPRRIPVAPSGAATLLTGPDGVPAIFLWKFGRGRILVLPADVLSNGRLASAGNADLLESIGRFLPGTIVFDEYHHGLQQPGAAPSGAAIPFDLLIFQGLLLYGLAVLALTRRLGRPWREPPTRSGTTASFLLGLAARHRSLGHYSAAAQLLLTRAARLDPAVASEAPRELPASSVDEETFVALAASLSRSGRREIVH